MALCGSPASRAAKCASRGRRRGPLARALPALAVLGLLIACAPTINWGSPPKITQLEALQRGASSKADVRKALGEPRGGGMARNADRRLRQSAGDNISRISREMWFYEFTRIEGQRVDLQILLVFFDRDKYDGHLWFSSTNLLDVQE